MSLPLTLSRAAQLLGVPRAVLQKHIAAGELPSHDGMVLSEDLEKLYPDIKLEDSGAFERIMQIKEQAFAKRVRERILPNQEILAQRLATQSEELEEVRRHLAEYHRLVEALSTRIDEMQKTAPSPQLAELARLLDDGLAAVLASEEPADRLEVLDDVLRVMTAQVKVRPSGREFFVEGNESVLEAALRAGLAPSYGCRNGNCGLCKARIVSGQVKQIHPTDYPLSASERAQGHALLCSNTAVTDLVIEMIEATQPSDIPEQEVTAKVKQVTPLSSDILLLHLQTPRSQRLRFLAGQSVTLSVSGATTNFQGDYPIASCPCDDRNLLFHIRRDDNDAFASRLFSDPFKPGDLVSVFGPFGEFVLQKDSSDDLLFIACDTGFAPIKSLIENAAAADLPGLMHLIWAATRPDGHYLANQCRAWAEALETFSFETLTAPDAAAAGTAAAGQVLAIPDFARREVYVAGPAEFIESVTNHLKTAGLPADHLRYETI